jgi:hypothetical protein
MSLSTVPLSCTERPVDERSLPSLHPSDEWGNKAGGSDSSGSKKEQASAVEDNNFSQQSRVEYPIDDKSRVSKQSVIMDRSFLSNNSFAEYLTHIIPAKFTNGCNTVSETISTYRDGKKTNGSRASERSGHSRCIIENTESIQERRDDHGRRDDGGSRDGDDNDNISYSVEEISQISEITMDMHTVMMGHKFASCNTLPTIAEARRYDPAIAACAAHIDAARQSKPQCGPGGKNNGKAGQNNDIIDFVFELVEEAFCTPLNRSKAEKKKAFMEAFKEESVKMARNNSLVDNYQSSSKHSRSNRTPRRSGKTPGYVSDDVKADSKAVQTKTAIVDKPPISALLPPKRSQMLDDEHSLDWSKIMSFAEQQFAETQLEAEEKYMKVEEQKRMSRSERRSFFQKNEGKMNTVSTATTAATSRTEQEQKSTASSLSNSSSTHATAVDSTANSNPDPVQELREMSVMDSSSFDEEPRLLLTALLLRSVLNFFPRRAKSHCHEAASKSAGPVYLPEESGDDRLVLPEASNDEVLAFKLLFYSVWFSCFIFWPSGIPRKQVEYKPIPKKTEKPSLLKLVTTELAVDQ